MNQHDAAIAWANQKPLQFRTKNADITVINGNWIDVDLNAHEFTPWNTYRLAQETININGCDVPKPLTVLPPYGTRFYVPDPNCPDSPFAFNSDNDFRNDALFFLGMCHSTFEAAIIHAKALINK